MTISRPDNEIKVIEVYCGELCKTDKHTPSELNLISPLFLTHSSPDANAQILFASTEHL